MSILAHWTMNDPTSRFRVWDSSGNGHHGDFIQKSEEMFVSDSPVGSLSVRLGTNAKIQLPVVGEIASISYWIKEGSGEWHNEVVVGAQRYRDGVLVGAATSPSAEYTSLVSRMVAGDNIGVSDVILADNAWTAADILNMYQVKTKILSNGDLHTKEFMENDLASSVSVRKNGIVESKAIEIREGVASFGKSGAVKVNNIVEK